MLHSQFGYVLGIPDSPNILSYTDIDALNVASLKKYLDGGGSYTFIITLCIEAAEHFCC